MAYHLIPEADHFKMNSQIGIWETRGCNPQHYNIQNEQKERIDIVPLLN